MHRRSKKTSAGFLTFTRCHVERSETSLTISAGVRNHDYWVYILTNKHCTTLYIGITNNIARRLYQHRQGEVDGFTKRYQLIRLVRDRMREEAEGLAAQQENCTYCANEPKLARSKCRLGTAAEVLRSPLGDGRNDLRFFASLRMTLNVCCLSC